MLNSFIYNNVMFARFNFEITRWLSCYPYVITTRRPIGRCWVISYANSFFFFFSLIILTHSLSLSLSLSVVFADVRGNRHENNRAVYCLSLYTTLPEKEKEQSRLWDNGNFHYLKARNLTNTDETCMCNV